MLKPGLVRFLLAMLVVFFHVTRYVFLGRFAVCSFFILSGYWITYMFDHKYATKSQPLKVFYISRLWRLFPVFYIFVALGFISAFLTHVPVIATLTALPLPDKIITLISHLFLLTFYSLPRFNVLLPAWSLDIELQFYLLFPLLYQLLKFNARYLIMGCILLCIAAFYVMQQYPNPWIGNSLIVFVYLFIIGMLIYHYQLKFTAKTEWLAIALFILIVAMQYIIPYASQHYKDEASLYYQLLSFVLTLLFIPTIANSVRNSSTKTDRLLAISLSWFILVTGLF